MNRLIIVGAGGHGKSVADNAFKNGYTDICFVDDHEEGDCMGIPVIARCEKLERLNDGKTDFVIGIGENAIRKKIAEEYDVNWVTLIHPSAQIALNVTIGKGTVVMAGAVVNACSSVGKHCIVNTGAIIEHDNTIEDYAHISPSAALSGTVHIGECTHIGIGASVCNNIDICGDCVIGGGSVVVKDIVNKGTYIGVPAKIKK